MPTIAWSPHGHDDAIRRILPLIDVILLDSDDLPKPGRCVCARRRPVRTTPTSSISRGCARRRGASGWRRASTCRSAGPRLRRVAALDVCHREHSTASGLLLAGWLASRLGWERAPLADEGGGRLHGSLRREGGEVAVSMRTLEQEAPGLGGVTVGSDRGDVAVAAARRGRTGCDRAADRRHDPASGRSSARRAAKAGSSARASGRRCCATRPTGRRSMPRGSSARRDAVAGGRRDPARAAAAMMISAALGGGQIVLAGGTTPRAANEQFVDAVRRGRPGRVRTTFWIGDERCVGPDDERSNFKMISESLIEPLAGVGSARRAADQGRARARGRRRRLRAAAARRRGARVRSGDAGSRARRPHGVAVPGPALARRAPAAGGRRARGGAGAVRTARDADDPGADRRQADRVSRRGRLEGRCDRGGVRARREARPAACQRRCWSPMPRS